jgi:hypothetical protein
VPVAASLRRCVASSSPSAELWRRPRAFLDGLHRPARSHANRRPEGISRAPGAGEPFLCLLPLLPCPRRVCLPEDVSASTLVKRKVDHPGTGHRAPGTAQHRTAQSIEFTVASGTPAAVLLSHLAWEFRRTGWRKRNVHLRILPAKKGQNLFNIFNGYPICQASLLALHIAHTVHTV